jgi:hypothetical protein
VFWECYYQGAEEQVSNMMPILTLTLKVFVLLIGSVITGFFVMVRSDVFQEGVFQDKFQHARTMFHVLWIHATNF